MPIGVMITMPDVTQKDYVEVTRRIFGRYPAQPADAPEGLILHSAGPVAGAWYVYDIWQSEEDFVRFGRERIEPAVREVVGRGFRDGESELLEIAYLMPVLQAAAA